MLDPDAVELVKELDGLPLAIATAGAYLDQTARSFSDYLRLYKESWVRLKETSPKLSSYEDKTLYSTWQISFDYIKQQNPLSANLLRLWAYFDNQDLWFELLQHSDSNDPEWIQELTKDELSFDSAVRVLINHGLVEVATSLRESIESKGYSIHGCVHSWIVHALNQERNCDLARVAVKFVGAHTPRKEDVRPWLMQQRLLPHAARCSFIVINGWIDDNRMAWAYYNLGFLYRQQGKLEAAEQMYERALAVYEKAPSIEHTLTLDTVNNLGIIYADQGKLEAAEQMFERALAGYEKALGVDHTLTLDTVHNLGALYTGQGKLEAAEQMYKRALAGCEKALGAEHTSTLDTVNNLGSLYRNQGKLEAAEQMFERALAGYQKALGAEHTSTLDTVNNLGNLYRNQGKLAAAKQMYERALAGKEKALGAEHTSTLTTANNLGILYLDQGKLEAAEEMFERALAGYKKALGAEHISTLDTVNNLGNLYRNQGKLAAAKQMYERALAGYEKALGEENTTTYLPALNTMSGLGALYESQDNIPKARIMYLKAFAGYKKVVGPDYPWSQSLRDKLGSLDAIIGDKALAVVKESEGPSHLCGKETPSKSKRSKLFRKLGLR